MGRSEIYSRARKGGKWLITSIITYTYRNTLIYDIKDDQETFESHRVYMIAGFIDSLQLLKVDSWSLKIMSWVCIVSTAYCFVRFGWIWVGESYFFKCLWIIIDKVVGWYNIYKCLRLLTVDVDGWVTKLRMLTVGVVGGREVWKNMLLTKYVNDPLNEYTTLERLFIFYVYFWWGRGVI